MQAVSCLFCKDTRQTVVVKQRDINLGLSPEVFTLVRCDGCGLIFLNPRPTPSEIHAFYPDEYYPLEDTPVRRPIDKFFKRLSHAMKVGIREEFYGYRTQGAQSRSAARRFFRRLALAPEYLHLRFAGRETIPFRGEGRILDVGCGPGKLLRVLREQGWDAHGVDFSSVAADSARAKHGLKVKCSDLLAAEYPQSSFDVVLFSHSLEHIYNPVETLREVHRILKPGGLLLIYVPNAGSFESHVFGKWWVQWDVPRHLFHFTKETITKLLVETGFRRSRITYGKGTSFFLGTVDTVYKHVFRAEMKHGWLAKHLVAGPVCLIAGHLGYGSEMKVYAEKAVSG